MINITGQQNLLLNIAQKLPRRIIVYAIGGTAMMFHGFKGATLDIDLVFTSEEDRNAFKLIAEDLDYKRYNHQLIYGAKINSPIMFRRGKGDQEERFDLFTTEVIAFIFSAEMMERAKDTYEFDRNLILKIADPHDIILMKCATERTKDKEDAQLIINNYKINWNIIIDEAKKQIELGKDRAAFDLACFLEDLTKMKVNIPREVLNKLFEIVEKQVKAKISKR